MVLTLLDYDHISHRLVFDIVCNVHRNQLYKQTNKMHFLYVFIPQFLYNSTCFERPFRSSSGVHDLLYLQLCTELQIRSSSGVHDLLLCTELQIQQIMNS